MREIKTYVGQVRELEVGDLVPIHQFDFDHDSVETLLNDKMIDFDEINKIDRYVNTIDNSESLEIKFKCLGNTTYFDIFKEIVFFRPLK